MFHRALVETPGCRVRRLGGNRRNEMRFHRFLRHLHVTVAEMAAGAGARTGALAAGRDIAVIQDTSEIYAGGAALAAKGFGPVGKGGATRGVLAHAAIAVDAATGALLGLADLAVWTREGGAKPQPRERRYEDKESHRWLASAKAAGERLAGARSVTMVSDSESDIYEYFAGKPEGVELLARARHDRPLVAQGLEVDGDCPALLKAALAHCVPARRFDFEVPAIPRRKARAAKLALRFVKVRFKRPPEAGRSLPESLPFSVVEVKEEHPPEGVAPLEWRLVTSHAVDTAERAREIVELYRGRFLVEDLFRTAKSAGIGIEDADIEDARAFVTFTALAMIAACSILQMVKARGGGTGQTIEHAFEPEDRPILEALCAKPEGRTLKQKNPHKPPDLAYASWVIARLGGWGGYYGKPGPQTMRHGFERYHAIKLGYQLADEK